MATNPTQKPLMDGLPGEGQAGAAGLMATALRKFQIDDENSIPAIVIDFDRNSNLITVKPLIMWVDMNDIGHSRHTIADLNCLSLGGGGFHISFPIKEGDLGWVIAADRDISLFKQSLKESMPNTFRVHSFADGLFIPDVFRKYVINGEDSGAMVLQSTDGATRISIRDDNIKITAPSNVVVDTPTTTFTGDVIIDKSLTVTQQTAVNGGFTAAAGQACDLPTETTVNGKQVDGHIHGAVVRGGDNTDPF